MPRKWNGLGLLQRAVVQWCAVPRGHDYLCDRINRQRKGSRGNQVLDNLVRRGYLVNMDGVYRQTLLGQKAVSLTPTAFEQWRALA